MAIIEFLLFILVGCGVGFMGGLFGIGGGVIMVPVLILSFEHAGVSQSVLTHAAIGTSLFVVVFTGFASAYQHKKQKNVDWRAVCVIGFSSAVTALAASRIALSLSGRHLRAAFAVIVIAAAIRMLAESNAKAEQKLEVSSKPKAGGLLAVGLTTGLVSALGGVGGGAFSIPMMYHYLKMPLKLAIGTSSATIVITAFFGVAGYIVNGLGRPGLPEWSLGFVDFQRGIALAVGTILLARVGAYVSYKTHPVRLKQLFAIWIIGVSVYLLLK